MTERPKWGKAGERLDAAEADRRWRTIQSQRNQARTRRELDDLSAYRRWRDGLVVPARITMALDLHMLEGPEVDAQCNAAEPEVDQWEAGERYPRWDQLVALAKLTSVTPRWFTIGEGPIPLWETSIWFHIKAPERRAYERHYRPPIMRFPRAVIEEARLGDAPEYPGAPI